MAGYFYGGFYLIAQSGRKYIDTLSFVFIFTFTSSIILFFVAQIKGYPFPGFDRHTWLIFLAIGLGVQVIGWLFINYSQGYLPASIVASTLLGQPVLKAILATLLIHEHLSGLHNIGEAIVVIGIYVVHYNRNKQAAIKD